MQPEAGLKKWLWNVVMEQSTGSPYISFYLNLAVILPLAAP